MSRLPGSGPSAALDLPPRILCVDDDPTMLLLLRECLEQAGFLVQEAASGEEALGRAITWPPDLVLLDVNMPGIDGFETCAMLRGLPVGGLLPIVMVTGQDDTDSIARAFQIGATSFLVKPVHWATLPYRLRYMLRASQAIQEERQTRRMLDLILDSIPVRVYWKGPDLRYRGCNRCFAEDVGLSASEIAGLRDTALPWASQADLFEADDRAILDGQGPRFGYEQVRVRHGGERLYVQANKVPLTDAEGEICGVLGTYEDITARKEAEAKIQVLAQRDSLTGLPNRALLNDRLRHAIAQAQRGERLLGVLFLDLDRFKTVNDNLGHHVGDELLVEAATRMRGCVRESDTVARLGGDEFVILLEMLDQAAHCTLVAEKILQVLEAPFHLAQQSVFISASIGIALYPLAGESAEMLMRNADTAMYQAKEAGRGRYSLYSREMSVTASGRLRTENALRQALEQEQFELWYQPLYEAQGGRLLHFEALLRWNRPGLGRISPADFVPLLEETGLIIPVGAWVLRSACRQAAAWRDRGLEPARVAVNLSTRQFNDPDLVDKILAALREASLEPERLELELTESCLVEDHVAANGVLRRLREMGVRLSLDDFGTGYSSMSYLRHFPLDTLKIDRSFIRDLPNDRDSVAITNAIIALGHSLNLNVVAEGVESAAQLMHLRAQGTDGIQGFLFNPPLPVDQATHLLTSPPAD